VLRDSASANSTGLSVILAPTLASRLEGQPNNFGFLRLVASLIVVFSHSFPIAGADLNYVFHNPYFGNYPVECFFVISGLLVTQSFIRGNCSVRRFVIARALRIYPALACGVLLSFVLATLCNEFPLAVTLDDRRTWAYLWKNITALEFVPEFAGAFPGNPIPNGPNGSLWSLPVELRLYVLVAVVGVANILGRTGIAVVVLATLAGIFALADVWLFHDGHAVFVAAFISGMAAYVLRDYLRLSFGFAALLLAAFVAAAVLGTVEFARLVFACCVPYWVLLLSCHTAIPIVKLPGDYSYGIYVFAFPIQQTVEWLLPDLHVAAFIAVSLGIVLVFAVTSWHWVEAPLLRLKPRSRTSDLTIHEVKPQR